MRRSATAGGTAVRAVAVPVATMWTSPDAPRMMDRPALLDVPDVAAWTAALDTAARKGLNGRTLTQLLLGDQVRVVESRGDWVRVVALDQASSADRAGYPGWMRAAHLTAPAPRQGRPAVVHSPTATCTLEDGSPLELSYGTRLAVVGRMDGHATVLLPGERRARVRLTDLDGDGRASGTPDPALLLSTAGHFLGLRYLWGGTSAWGLDCSGLVHLVFRGLGLSVPRDAFDQAAMVEPVPLADVQPGDLYFFARPDGHIFHVGFVSRPVGADGVRWMLHAPEGGELVEDAPLAPHRVDTLLSAGRVIAAGDGRPGPR